MRAIEGEQVLVRVFIGESDKWHRKPLYTALVERLRQEGFAGATVFKGVEGFGAKSVLHDFNLELLSFDMPVVIEIVDTAEQVEKLKLILDEMVGEGLVTLEKVHVLRYLPRTESPTPERKPGRLRRALSRKKT